MTTITGWLARAGSIFRNDGNKGPWGSGGSGGEGGGGNGSGPRNPWAFPPEGKRARPGATSLDELLRRARSGGGGGGGGGGFPGIPGGRNLWFLIAGGLVLLWVVFTSFHQIAPQQQGVVTFFGRYSGTLQPGIRMTLPAPFNAVQKLDVSGMRTEDFPASGENLMLTSDQNIVDLQFSVRWNIANPQDFAFQINAPEETIKAVAESAMRAVVATMTLDDTIGGSRSAIEVRVQNLMQQILDEYRAGVRVQGIAIKNASAPRAVDEDFKKVSAAQQEAQGNLNNARAYAQQTLAYAQGAAAEFDKIYEQYKVAPEVTRRRLYYETMEQVLERADKTVIEAPGVTPFLPLHEAARRRLPEAEPQPQAGAAR